MKITLIFSGHLRHFRGNREEVEISSHESLGQVLERLKIPQGEVMTFFINGRNYHRDHVPSDGDGVEVIPSLSGG
jgi:sulfur carrier protein ThiS